MKPVVTPASLQGAQSPPRPATAPKAYGTPGDHDARQGAVDPLPSSEDIGGEPPRIVIMGVSGCGKSTVGEILARRSGWRFIDGDELHSATARSRMESGIPLDDDTRAPWLDRVGDTLADEPGGIVVACSALKRSYRDRIRHRAPGTVFIHLDGDRERIAAQLGSRRGHFMPASLLDSQLTALEPLGSDEPGGRVPLDRDPLAIARRAERLLAQRHEHRGQDGLRASGASRAAG